ncbi:hypothetical protein OEZ86_012321 [Tetradesmus obliquus]|nr:hypothetical protein OEZ86_012321 [Tetradesmus obliquus]
MELVRIPFYCLYSAYAIAANRVCNAIAGACQARLYAQIMRASVKEDYSATLEEVKESVEATVQQVQNSFSTGMRLMQDSIAHVDEVCKWPPAKLLEPASTSSRPSDGAKSRGK